MNYDDIRNMLIQDEALRLKPYQDTEGKWTIGVGRNLTDDGISRDEAMILLDNDINAAISALNNTLPWWRSMSPVRQNVIINMCFNLGIAGLSRFKKALSAMQDGDYETAANEMENSTWYHEVGGRGIRLVSLMRNGQ